MHSCHSCQRAAPRLVDSHTGGCQLNCTGHPDDALTAQRAATHMQLKQAHRAQPTAIDTTRVILGDMDWCLGVHGGVVTQLAVSPQVRHNSTAQHISTSNSNTPHLTRCRWGQCMRHIVLRLPLPLQHHRSTQATQSASHCPQLSSTTNHAACTCHSAAPPPNLAALSSAPWVTAP